MYGWIAELTEWKVEQKQNDKTVSWNSHQAHLHHDCLCALQLTAAQRILLYFAAAVCNNYVRYGSFYVHLMKSVTQHLLMMDTECSRRLLRGINNVIFIEYVIDITWIWKDVWPGNDLGKNRWAHVQLPWHLPWVLPHGSSPAMFDTVGHTCITQKSALRNSLQVTISSRSTCHVHAVINYMSTFLWTIRWPPRTNLNKCIPSTYDRSPISLQCCFCLWQVFPVSTRIYTRQRRQDKYGISRVRVFKPEIPAHPKSSILSVSSNKIQLNRMLTNALLDPQFYIPATQEGYSLTFAGLENAPLRIQGDVQTEMRDLCQTKKRLTL